MKTNLTLTILLSFFSLIAQAQWGITGLSGGTVKCLANDGTRIYAGTANIGLQVSGDGGANWADMSSGLPGTSVLSIDVNGTSIYAGFVQQTVSKQKKHINLTQYGTRRQL